MGLVRRGERSESAPVARRTREWDPFQTMRELMGTFAPAFDVRETKDAYLFKADLPGFREEDIDINLTGNRLTVSGKREAEQHDESDTYYCSERSYGSFVRTFTLPDGVDSEQIRADLKDGILSLQVPKTAEAQPRKISFRGGGEKQLEKPVVGSNGSKAGEKRS